MTVSTRTLQILAALVWYTGGVVLLLKGGSLLREAQALRPEGSWPVYAMAIGFLAGTLKGATLFRKSCRNNLDRIERLQSPRAWQVFRPRFFVLLSLMILTGTTLSRLAQGRYGPLIGVAILDLAIATALLTSSYLFWMRWAGRSSLSGR